MIVAMSSSVVALSITLFERRQVMTLSSVATRNDSDVKDAAARVAERDAKPIVRRRYDLDPLREVVDLL